MSQCLNPDCLQPNLKTTIFCQKCGSKLLLRERYRALKILGQGGFGRTFLAVDEDKPSKPYCVIKQFLPQAQGTNNQEKAGELFEQEAIQLEHLGKHQQIPELFAHFIQDNRQYLVQEYIPGQNLLQELAETGAFSETKIINLLGDLLPVLAFIHQKPVIHRDIKPENIIRRQGDNKLVLVDFGAAKAATRTALAVTGTVIGSAGYVAPEQAVGKPIFASDLYSLGVTCIHLFTNKEPFDLFDSGEGDWVWRDYLTVTVNNTLGQVLDKLLQQGTRKRFQTAQEVLEALQLTEKPISPPTPQPTPPPTVKPTPQPTPPPTVKPTPQFTPPPIVKLTPQPTPQPNIKLKSAKGVNYHQLGLGVLVLLAGLHLTGIFRLPFLPGRSSPTPKSASVPTITAVTPPEQPSPNSTLDPFSAAVKTAINTANLYQTAQTKADWTKVAAGWQEASALMKKVPQSHPKFTIAQDRAVMYANNQKRSEQKAEAAPYLFP